MRSTRARSWTALGTALDGSSKYVMHFEKNLAAIERRRLVDLAYRDNFYVRNSLERYGILSSMPLKFNADGSLDVYIQATSPVRTRSPTGCRARRAARSISQSGRTSPRSPCSTAATSCRQW